MLLGNDNSKTYSQSVFFDNMRGPVAVNNYVYVLISFYNIARCRTCAVEGCQSAVKCLNPVLSVDSCAVCIVPCAVVCLYICICVRVRPSVRMCAIFFAESPIALTIDKRIAEPAKKRTAPGGI